MYLQPYFEDFSSGPSQVDELEANPFPSHLEFFNRPGCVNFCSPTVCQSLSDIEKVDDSPNIEKAKIPPKASFEQSILGAKTA